MSGYNDLRRTQLTGSVEAQFTPTARGLDHRRSVADILERTRAVEGSPTRPSSGDQTISSGNASGNGNGSDQHDPETCPYGCCEKESLGEYIMKKGFFEGACSDITLKAFGTEYRLHRLILSRSGYFSSLFMGPWSDPESSTHELVFDHDPYITQEALELAIARLYGSSKMKSQQQHLLNMIAIGQYLDIPDMVCSSTDHLISSLSFKNIAQLTSFATQNNYGSASERIVDSAKGFLCSNGYQSGVKAWDGVPSQIIASVVGLDSFFVPSEWDRALFIVKLVERRQRVKGSSPGSSDEESNDVDDILETLNTRVHFCHLTAEQLHKLENMSDVFGKPFVNPHVLKDALWLSIQLHKKVATSDVKTHDLGLTTSTEQPPDNIGTWFVPTKDETLYGTPDILETNIRDHHHIRDDLPSGKTTENAGESLYRVTKIPPFRFSIAFSGVSELEAEKRVYAKTLWYAGSYWNLYIQKIRHRKGFQMGVYIHRATSCTPSRSGLLNHDVINASFLDDSDEMTSLASNVHGISINDDLDLDLDHELLTGMNARNANDSVYRDDGDDGGDPYDNDGNDDDNEDDSESNHDYSATGAHNVVGGEGGDASFLSYEDGRVKTSVYYIIYTPSRKVKTSLTCFISTPDLFKKSQSWGWKSNSMCAFNEDGTLAEGQEKLLKFMVVLGNT